MRTYGKTLKDRYCDFGRRFWSLRENERGLRSRKEKIRRIAECATPYNRPSLKSFLR